MDWTKYIEGQADDPAYRQILVERDRRLRRVQSPWFRWAYWLRRRVTFRFKNRIVEED